MFSITSSAILIISTASLIAVAAVAYVISLSSVLIDDNDAGTGTGAGACRVRGGSGGGGDAALMSPATVAAAAANTTGDVISANASTGKWYGYGVEVKTTAGVTPAADAEDGNLAAAVVVSLWLIKLTCSLPQYCRRRGHLTSVSFALYDPC